MGQPQYNGVEISPDAIAARNARSCARLLDLLCTYHPTHCPEVAHKRNLEIAKGRRITKPDPVPQPEFEKAAIPPPPTEDERIAAWVARQLSLQPSHRPWNDHAGGISVRAIQSRICEHFGIERDDMASARRTAPLVLPRQIAMFLSRKLTPKSLPEIGRAFGGKDHTTILHAVRKVSYRIERDPDFRRQLESIAIELGGEL